MRPGLQLRVFACALALAGANPASALEIVATRSERRDVLERVAKAATCVLHLKEFRKALASIDTFRDSKHDGRRVLKSFDEAGACPLGTYRRGGLFGYFMYWDRVDARHVRGSTEVQFNLNRFQSADMAFLVGTAVHECSHLIGYSHRYNDVVRHPEIRESVPYVVGALAERFAPKCLNQSLESKPPAPED